MLGCGEIGYLLLERESRFTILDVEGDTLRERGYTAVTGDPGNRDTLKRIGIEKAEVVVVLEKGLSGLDTVRELNPEAFILCVVEREKKGEERVSYAKADCIVPSSLCAADECLYQIKQHEKRKRKKTLEDILRSGKKMAIILHDNPDPDCISSALSLKLIGEKMGVTSDLFYGGQIGYSENRVLVELLEVELVSPEPSPDFTGYDLSAFVDHSPWDYTSIARDVNPEIVLDHHILPEYKGKFVDVRENVGSTSVILVEYMQLFGVEIDSKLATGLFYGLLVDTDSFRRGIFEEDIEALKVLRRKMDTELLSQVERSEFSRGVKRSHIDADFLGVLGEAVKNMRVKGRVVFSSVGKVKYRDAVSNSADYLLKLEKVDIVVVYGVIGGSVYISARSFDGKLHMGKLLKEAFQGLGRAGGHPLTGGATIPLEKLSQNFEEDIMKRILQVLSHYS
jgi:nanoRNase/pAp phosphatase (c-di-AMP/oligoRNAs hydrolase)